VEFVQAQRGCQALRVGRAWQDGTPVDRGALPLGVGPAAGMAAVPGTPGEPVVSSASCQSAAPMHTFCGLTSVIVLSLDKSSTREAMLELSNPLRIYSLSTRDHAAPVSPMVRGLTLSAAGISAGDFAHTRRAPNAASIWPVPRETRDTPPVPVVGDAVQSRNEVLRTSGWLAGRKAGPCGFPSEGQSTARGATGVGRRGRHNYKAITS